MLFGATHACPRCLVRFAAQERCPSCGSPERFDLSRSKGRSELRKRARARAGAGRRPSIALTLALARAAEWVPSRPWIVRAVGLALTVPAIGMIVDPHFGRELWFWHDSKGHMGSYWEGLTQGGITMIGFAVAGVVLLVSSVVPHLAAMAAKKVARADGTSLRLHAPPSFGPGDAIAGVVRGEAKRAAPLSKRPCIAFGLRGDADGATVDDAEGDDFELETPAGERFLVRVDHALLMVDPAPLATAVELDDDLARLLDARGVRGASACTLAEATLGDGDEVTVCGRLGKAKRPPASYRDEPVSTLEGTAERSLRIHKRVS